VDSSDAVPLLELRGVSRHYGPVAALSEVDFTCRAGEIHAVLGENGAGKSTLMKLIAGVVQPTPGEIFIEARATRLATPAAAQSHGIVCMFQELSLAPDLSVRDNLLLGARSTGLGLFSYRKLGHARALLDRIGGESIRLTMRVRDLTLPDRQLVEIVKALYRSPRLLILDEATSALNASVVERVFDLLRELRDEGLGVLFISHRFHEVDALADRISVFRNGRLVETFDNGAYDYGDIIRLMIGQPLTALFPPKASVGDRTLGVPTGPPLLSVHDLSWEGGLHQVNLDVRAGSITGIGGLDGQGQTILLHALFGVLRRVHGEVRLDGHPIRLSGPRSAKAPAVGLALVPEDRKTEGLIPALSIRDNVTLALLGREAGRGDGSEADIAALASELELVCASFDQPVGSLSGGNQQKVALMKWLALKPRVLLLADPTRGIDVKTKAQIYTLLRRLATNGIGIVLLTTDQEELVHLCDEVHVFYGGRVVQRLAGESLTSENVIAASLNVAA